MWDQIKNALGDSASRLVTGVASILPGVVAMLAALVLAVLVGRAVRAVLGRMLRGVSFDERLERLGFTMLAEFSPEHSPALLVVRLVFWSIVVLGFLIGLSAIDPAQTGILFAQVLAFVPNAAVAILLLVFGAVVARFLGRSVLIGAVNARIESARLLSVGVKWLVMVLASAMALNHLSIGGEVLTLAFGILFGGIVLALSLAVGLGSKEMVQKSWERRAERAADRRREHHDEPAEVHLQHL